MNVKAWDHCKALAQNLGFSKVFALSTECFSAWQAEVSVRKDRYWDALTADPLEVMPTARTLLLLVWSYTPYAAFPQGSASIDAYYVASQAAYVATQSFVRHMGEQGHTAIAAQNLPARQALLRTGEAFAGRCALSSLPSLGTRLHLQLVLTDAEFPAVSARPQEILAPECAQCALCIRRCPTQAILPHGAIHTGKCLRAQRFDTPVPISYRKLLGTSILGCDLCQRICPRNSQEQPVEPPASLVDALQVERLLSGDTKPLSAWIGINYARPVRIQARAALIAANLGRHDLLQQLRALCDSPHDVVREHALWAVEQLQ